MTKSMELLVNGVKRSVDPTKTLLSALRDDLDLTSAKYGCGEGQCGACTVLVDGKPTRSCLVTADSVTGKTITTLEGLERSGHLHPVQQAFVDEVAMQCGYCIPGMIMSGVALLDSRTNPTNAEIVEALNGNICRCGSHPRILAAIRRAAASRKGGTK